MIKLEPGDIILCVSHNIVGRLILWVMKMCQKDPVHYSHVAMAMEDNYIIQARLKIEEVKFDQSNYHSIKILRYKKFNDEDISKIALLTRSVINRNYGVKRFLAHFLDEMLRINYFTSKINCTNQQICSSLVAWIYYAVLNIKFNDLDWTQVDPDDFDDHYMKDPDNWEVVYEGKG